MRIQVVHEPIKGAALLLVPGAILLRWPNPADPPRVGDEFRGKIVEIRDPEHRKLVGVMLDEESLERYFAARKLPLSVVKDVYSKTHAYNLRRVGTRMTPGLRNHVEALIADGERVTERHLVYAVAGRTEREQLRRWNRMQGED